MTSDGATDASLGPMRCLFCAQLLEAVTAENLPSRQRLVFDPELGRLWQACSACRRWNAVPFEDRWEVLELCERLAHRGSVLLESEHLCLLATGGRQLLRVGRPARVEFAVWRYSDLLDAFTRPRGFIARLLHLPERPVGGNIGPDYHGGVVTVPRAWIGSPFVEHGGLLTLFFASVPLAGTCPGCGHPFMLNPASFSDVRLEQAGGGVSVVAQCALCQQNGAVPLESARATLRTALAIVSRAQRSVSSVTSAVEPVDRHGTAQQYVARLAADDAMLGSLEPGQRLALWMSLDEMAEAEFLEAEWRRAEQLASIMDGELTDVPGYSEFRSRVIAEGQ